jgi:hypothetical protein
LILAVVIITVSNLALADKTASRYCKDLEKPFQLQADGQFIDSGANWGHCGPCAVDIDGDGLKDLIVGDFSGYFTIYKNVGTATSPEYKVDGRLQVEGQDAKVNIYCCMGAQARFCDLDADGTPDMISNSYDPGHCYLFSGLKGSNGKIAFAAPKDLLDKSGTPIRSYPKQEQTYQSFGSFYETVDWDNDGDLDLLIGTLEGALKLRINEGTAKQAMFATNHIDVQVDNEPLKVNQHLCPVIADWDGDGLWDIIAGSDDGSVSFFRNIGKLDAPAFAKGEVLVSPHEDHIWFDAMQTNDGDLTSGIRSQVEITDFNGDGKLDLLVGDFYTAFDIRADLTEAQKHEFDKLVDANKSRIKAAKERTDKLRSDLAKRFPGEKVFSEEAFKVWKEEVSKLPGGFESEEFKKADKAFVDRVRPFLASTQADGDQGYALVQPHGHVWVYLHK